MFAWLFDGKPSATPLHLSDVTPPFTGLSSIALVVGTFVAFAGLELNAVHIEHLKGRPRTYFKAVFAAALLVFVMYMLGSIAISVAVPDATLELTSGASQAFTRLRRRLRDPGPLERPVGPVGAGCRRRFDRLDRRARAGACGWSGRAGYLPQRFQKVNKNDVQMPILFFQGVIVTILSLVFVVAPNTSSAFAVLQDISIVLYMTMYICMFASAIRLRRTQPDVPRPIRIAGLKDHRNASVSLAAISAIVLGLTPPAGYTPSREASTPASWSSASWCSHFRPNSSIASADRSGPAPNDADVNRRVRAVAAVHDVKRRDNAMIDLETYVPKGDKKNSEFFEEFLPRVYERRRKSGLDEIVGETAALVVQVEHGDGVAYLAELSAMGPYRFQAARLTETHKVYLLVSRPEFPRLVVLEPLAAELRGRGHAMEHALPPGPKEAQRALHRRDLQSGVHAGRAGGPGAAERPLRLPGRHREQLLHPAAT